MIIDPLWGPPAVAAARAAGHRARLVNLGQSAGAEAPLHSGDVRGKMLSILGHANGTAPPEVKRDAYLRLVGLAAEGRMELPSEILGLDALGQAWERQAASPQVKLIIDPRGASRRSRSPAGRPARRARPAARRSPVDAGHVAVAVAGRRSGGSDLVDPAQVVLAQLDLYGPAFSSR